MGDERDKILKELYSPLEDLASEEETRRLKEIARGLISIEKAESSSSFRDELRKSLMQEVPQLQADAWSDKLSGKWLKQFYRDLGGAANRFRSSYAFVAAALIIIVMAVFSHQPWDSPGRIADPGRPAHEQRPSLGGEQTGVAEETLPGEQPGLEVPGDDPALGAEALVGTPDGDAGPQSEETVSHGEETMEVDPGPDEPTIPEKPKFGVEEDLHDLYLAGAVIISPLYAGDAGEEKTTYNNVPATLRPNGKYALAAPEDAAPFGSNAWAGELLKGQGFITRNGDNLEIKTQETLEGNFAEIFYQPGGKGSRHPILVLQCKEPGNILGYYYKEGGTLRETGYYPLLTPTQALKAQQLDMYSSSQPSLIFTEVRIEFSDFLLDDGKGQQNVMLPAYCFIGRETAADSEIKICLPAVSR